MKKKYLLIFLVFILVVSCTVISRNDGQSGGESAASLITVTEVK